MTLRSTLARLMPTPLRAALRDRKLRNQWRDLESLPPRDLFQHVYERELWGRSPDGFFSGSGSHDAGFVAAYRDGVARAVGSHKPSVVDIGCGDFAIGSSIRSLFSTYIACDVVASLIARNRAKFAALDVDFRVLDLTADPLPPADVVIIKQVLQHCSNAQIATVVPKLSAYRLAIISEHIPFGPFTPNREKPPGPHTRLDDGGAPSGIVLTAPPFNLKAQRSTVLAEVRDYIGIIRTTAYEMQPLQWHVGV